MFASRTNWRLDRNHFTQALETHRCSGKELFDLTVSNPTECGLVYPEKEILQALGNPRMMKYTPESKGLREAREAVSGYYRQHSGFGAGTREVDPDNVLLTSGTSEGYSHIFRLLCEPGDEVLVPAPSYPLVEFLADLADIRLISYPLFYDHGWQIDFDSLRSALTDRSRAVLVVHPNNPTGSFVKSREAAELAQLCTSRGMAIVADEVFLDYAGQSVDADSVAANHGAGDFAARHDARTFAKQDGALTFTLSGLSKISLLPQMKLAWIVASGPPALLQPAVERLEVIADTYLSPGAAVQLALPSLLSFRAGLQNQLQQRISANLATLDAVLRESKSVTRLIRESGWYAVLRVPVTGSDEDLAVNLLERSSVLVHPGHFFNFSRDGFLVISLITPEDQFQEGSQRLGKFFED